MAQWQALDYLFKIHIGILNQKSERYSNLDTDYILTYLSENPIKKYELYIMAAYAVVKKSLPDGCFMMNKGEILG